MKIFKKIDNKLEEVLLVILVVGITMVMSAHVILRYFFKSPLVWAEEACRYMFVWITFLSIGYSIKKDMLLKVDALLSKFNIKIKRSIEFISEILTILLFIILFKNSITVLQKVKMSGQTSPALGLPMVYIYESSTVGFFLGILRYLQFLYHKYFKKDLIEKSRLETTTN